MKLYVYLFFYLLTVPALSQQEVTNDRRAILLVLQRQTDDWNAGRLDKFMSSYWPSDSLTFVGKTGVTYGYQPTLASYKKRYPDRASMGTLKFDILQLDFPAPNVAYVIGRWHLTRPKIGDAGGHFTLLWRKIKNVGLLSVTIPVNSEQPITKPLFTAGCLLLTEKALWSTAGREVR